MIKTLSRLAPLLPALALSYWIIENTAALERMIGVSISLPMWGVIICAASLFYADALRELKKHIV